MNRDGFLLGLGMSSCKSQVSSL